jgi:hypothetical protein
MWFDCFMMSRDDDEVVKIVAFGDGNYADVGGGSERELEMD